MKAMIDFWLFTRLMETPSVSADLHLRQLPEHRLLLSEGREGPPSEPADWYLQLQQPQQ